MDKPRRSKAASPDWLSNRPRVTSAAQKLVTQEYQERLDGGEPRQEILGNLGERHGRDERTIERWIRRGRQLLQADKETEIRALVSEEVAKQAGSETDHSRHLEVAQKEHHDRLRDLIIEWRDSLYVPLPIRVDDRSRDPIADVLEHRLFRRLREHLDDPTVWLECWLWYWYFGIGYSGSCDWVKADMRNLWGGQSSLSSPSRKHRYYMPVYERIEHYTERLRRGIGVGASRAVPHVVEVKKKRGTKASASQQRLSLVYVDGELVGECRDTDGAVEAYRSFSDRVVATENTQGLLFSRMILEDLAQTMRSRLDVILERQSYVRNPCRECPAYDGANADSGHAPVWATPELYESMLRNHFDDMVALGSVVWSRLEALLEFKEKHREVELAGNIADGVDWCSHDVFPMWFSSDIAGIGSDWRLDTLLAECLIHHFARRSDFDAEWTDWRDVTFENLHRQTVDALFTMVFERDFRYEGNCPVCHGLKQVFEMDEPVHRPW